MPVESPSIGGFQDANGVVYAAHTLGKLRAFNAENGDVLWTDQVGFSQASGTTVSNGRLFITHGFQFIQIVMAPPGMEGGIRVYGIKQTPKILEAQCGPQRFVLGLIVELEHPALGGFEGEMLDSVGGPVGVLIGYRAAERPVGILERLGGVRRSIGIVVSCGEH